MNEQKTGVFKDFDSEMNKKIGIILIKREIKGHFYKGTE
jgi:hypothetical protein